MYVTVGSYFLREPKSKEKITTETYQLIWVLVSVGSVALWWFANNGIFVLRLTGREASPRRKRIATKQLRRLKAGFCNFQRFDSMCSFDT